MSDTDIGVYVGPSDWILAEAALSFVLADRYADLTKALNRDDTISVEHIKDGIRPLERVRHAILEAVYPEPEPVEERCDFCKRTLVDGTYRHMDAALRILAICDTCWERGQEAERWDEVVVEDHGSYVVTADL